MRNRKVSQLDFYKNEFPYDVVFWLSYLANVALSLGSALAFRFADLVAYLGADNTTTGAIVGLASAMALVMRFFFGLLIDHFGLRVMWLLAASAFVWGLGLLSIIHNLSWQLWLARSLYVIGAGACLTCALVHLQKRITVSRHAEVIALYGSSGFVGMFIGSTLGDWISVAIATEQQQYFWLFGTACICGVLNLLCVYHLMKGSHDQDSTLDAPAISLLISYWPCRVLIVAMILGVCFTIPTVF